jgi:hypothetical protein
MFLGGRKALGALFNEQGASLLPASPQGKDNVRSSVDRGVGEPLSKKIPGLSNTVGTEMGLGMGFLMFLVEIA